MDIQITIIMLIFESCKVLLTSYLNSKLCFIKLGYDFEENIRKNI